MPANLSHFRTWLIILTAPQAIFYRFINGAAEEEKT